MGACDHLPVELLSVGEVAARLGVSPSAVRMWGTRYGLVASARSEGGHRRYTPEDVALLSAVHEAVLSGTDPAAAADRSSWGAAARRLARAGALPGAVALAAVAVLWRLGDVAGLQAQVSVLLALTFPHAAVVWALDRRAPTAA